MNNVLATIRRLVPGAGVGMWAVLSGSDINRSFEVRRLLIRPKRYGSQDRSEPGVSLVIDG